MSIDRKELTMTEQLPEAVKTLPQYLVEALGSNVHRHEVVAAIARLRDDTIEECAKVCDNETDVEAMPDWNQAAINCAAKIRLLRRPVAP